MAYNLQSLITILQGILDPEQTRWILGPEKPQLQSLLEKASYLQQQILQKTPLLTKLPSLECQIRDVANEAEDIVESHMVRRIFSMHLECQIRDEANESYMLERLFSMPEEEEEEREEREEEEEEDTTPDVLTPDVLTPDVLTPIVLTPDVLTPDVLTPDVLTPIVLTPDVLTPDVLTPDVLTPDVLTPDVLTPIVLTPDVLTPDVLTPIVLLVTQKLDSVIEQVEELVEVERNKKPTGSSWSGDGASFTTRKSSFSDGKNRG